MTTAANILVGSGGTLYVGAVGEALPEPNTPTAALGGGWTSVGFLSEDGISLSAETTVEDILAYQSLLPVRKVVTARTFELSTTLREWSADNIVLAFGGGTVTDHGAYAEYTPPAVSDAVNEVALVLDWADGDKNYRLCVARATVTNAVETTISRTSPADLPITFSVLDSNGDTYWLLTDDPSFQS